MEKVFKNLSTKLLMAFVVLFATTSCSDNDDNGMPADGNARLVVKLVDAPGDYEAVNVDIQDVMINREGEAAEGEETDTTGGWESIGEINAGVYDLLELTGGANVVLADNQLPAGEIEQIRLVLGENNSVVVDGEEIMLKTPSAQQSGLKINLEDAMLEEGFTYEIILDFDADQSVVAKGTGEYNLKPVIRASTEVNSGIITGSVSPVGEFQVMASVISGEDTISSIADESGIYALYGVPGGTYDLVLTPDEESGYAEAVVEGVEVVNGEITEVEAVELQMAEAETGGSITGTIANPEEGIIVTASVTVGEGEAATEITADADEAGVFTLEGVAAGTYTVTLTPGEGSAYGVNTVADVTVVDGETTDLGDITLE
ncbi:DUF4382 domain-containing protein [Galbibacter sp. EGI 63066]|uniref:DUF4382 domain-containing protein n=1 Tax=Galbibacter sp. EGI 63066 TaxID=2993559 RepID=UPI002248BE78|nr:DUF4382 domain-containing protein [Galbibacter sp. EGI 63066]MCX2680603.1 DUF4382 domain-containing protein [Galbibacter sp. EGI 63066]